MLSKSKQLEKLQQPFFIYLIVVSVFGIFLSLLGIFELTNHSSITIYLVLLLLAVAAQFSTTSVPVAGKAGITYQVAAAVVVASIPFYGPAPAAFLNSVSAFSLWLIKPTNETTWKKSKEQLFFNMGMSAVSVFVAGLVFTLFRDWLMDIPVLAATLPWLICAIVYDQVNLWLLFGIVRLQNGPEIKFSVFWKDYTWAVPISIMLITVGGGLLAFAIDQFDWLGAFIFFLPIILSALAFRLYVNQMQSHMDNLEEIIDERTGNLAMANVELGKANEELEQLNHEKDAFLAVLTHDMKTPLTAIGLYTDLLKQKPELLLEKPHMLDYFTRSQSSLLEIVNNILDLASLESGQEMNLQREHLEIIPVIELQLELIAVQAEERNIDLKLGYHSDELVVTADRDKMERIFRNLVSNALKYTPKGGRVEVDVKKAGEEALISIKDSGFGIPANELPFIFQPYRRIEKHKSKAKGTGLGLAITKALVEAHGGKIEVTSEENIGSTFVVHLPLENGLNVDYA